MPRERDLLQVGDPAPDFSLLDDRAREVRLAALRGRPVVLFFYAEDDTPVCTAQACGFRDDIASFRRLRAEVFGVSADAPETHAAFRRKHALPFRLLSDPGHQVAARYGAHGEKVMYGRKVVGTIRSSVIVDDEGRIAGVFRGVRSASNGRKMAEALAELAGSRARA